MSIIPLASQVFAVGVSPLCGSGVAGIRILLVGTCRDDRPAGPPGGRAAVARTARVAREHLRAN
jgi:hypothetical protein